MKNEQNTFNPSVMSMLYSKLPQKCPLFELSSSVPQAVNRLDQVSLRKLKTSGEPSCLHDLISFMVPQQMMKANGAAPSSQKKYQLMVSDQLQKIQSPTLSDSTMIYNSRLPQDFISRQRVKPRRRLETRWGECILDVHNSEYMNHFYQQKQLQSQELQQSIIDKSIKAETNKKKNEQIAIDSILEDFQLQRSIQHNFPQDNSQLPPQRYNEQIIDQLYPSEINQPTSLDALNKLQRRANAIEQEAIQKVAECEGQALQILDSQTPDQKTKKRKKTHKTTEKVDLAEEDQDVQESNVHSGDQEQRQAPQGSKQEQDEANDLQYKDLEQNQANIPADQNDVAVKKKKKKVKKDDQIE